MSKMDIIYAAGILECHNRWRRGDDNYDMANPTELGVALETAVEIMKSYDNLLQAAKIAREALLTIKDRAKPTRSRKKVCVEDWTLEKTESAIKLLDAAIGGK